MSVLSKGTYLLYALERARIFRRLRLSRRDLFFFHFSLMLEGVKLEKTEKKRMDDIHDLVKRALDGGDGASSGIEAGRAIQHVTNQLPRPRAMQPRFAIN